MRFDFGFYSSILLIFFVHGFIYAILLLRKAKQNDTKAEKWLAFFLFLCILYICPWMLGFAGWYDNQPYRDFLFYVPTQQVLLMGPVVFFYLQSLLNPTFTLTRKDYWHFLPAGLYFLFSLVMFVTDKLILKKYFFLASGADPDFDFWYQLVGFLSMLIYFLLSLRYYNVYRKMIVQLVSYADLVLFKWIRNFLQAFLLMLLLKLAFYVLSIPFPNLEGYVGNWWYFFAFSLIFYYIAITGYSNSVTSRLSFKVNDLWQQRPQFLISYPPEIKETNHEDIIDVDFVPIADESGSADFEPGFPVDFWKAELLRLFENDRVYESETLSLTDLARSMKLSPTNLSKLVNKGFGSNFNDFVNRYRVLAVMDLLKAGEQKSQTLLGIAYDCGFNSKATFNRAFKKVTGVSPKDWIDKNS